MLFNAKLRVIIEKKNKNIGSHNIISEYRKLYISKLVSIDNLLILNI